jgi:hypothetical protein
MPEREFDFVTKQDVEIELLDVDKSICKITILTITPFSVKSGTPKKINIVYFLALGETFKKRNLTYKSVIIIDPN